MSSSIGQDNTFDLPKRGHTQDQEIPEPPPRVTSQRSSRAEGTVVPFQAPPVPQPTMPGTRVGGARQIACYLSPKVAAATRRAEREYGSLGAVLIHALHDTHANLIEHFTRSDGDAEPPGDSNGFVLPAPARKRRKKPASERVVFRIDAINAERLGELLKQCGEGRQYSRLCNEALRRFLNVPEGK